MKKLYEGKVMAQGSDIRDVSGLLDSIRHIGEGDTSASRAFLLESHDVKLWIIAGKLEMVLDSFLVVHDISITKKKESAYDVLYLLEDGLSLHAYQFPPDQLTADTDKFVLSLKLDGIDHRNVEKARTIFEDLRGIPV